MLEDPRNPLAGAIADATALTDRQLQLMDAVTKVRVLKALVHQAVENMMGLNLTWDEKVLVLQYRDWRSSPKAVSGIFHCRIPRIQDVARIVKNTKLETDKDIVAAAEAEEEEAPNGFTE